LPSKLVGKWGSEKHFDWLSKHPEVT
jgi:hypothetical protein